MSFKSSTYLCITVIFSILLGFKYFNWVEIGGFPLFVPVLLALVGFLGEVYEIEILPDHSVSVSTAIYIGAIIIGGTTLGLAVTIPSLLLSEAVIRGESFMHGATFAEAIERVVFNTAQHVIAITAAGLLFSLAAGHSAPFVALYDYFPPLVAFSAYMLVNISLVSGIVTLTEGSSFLYQLKVNLRNLHIQTLSMGALSILFAIAYESSPWNILLVATLLFLVDNSLRNYVNLREQAKRAFEKIMDLLSKRDPYTYKHSEFVGKLSAAIVDELHLPSDKKKSIVSAARIHDIGKLGIPDSILLKNGKLNEEEWKTMKQHPELGAEILSGLSVYNEATGIVRHEHERCDGSGYPDGLTCEDIPLGSRIIAVADVWHALRSKRPYKESWSVEESKKELKKMAGEKLDSEIVDALLSVVNKGQVQISR